MSQPNNWRTKREEQHESHNRKPGAARFWKGKRNKFTRRWDSKIRREQAKVMDISYFEMNKDYPKQITGPIEEMKTKNVAKGHRLVDLLDENTKRELNDQLSQPSS